MVRSFINLQSKKKAGINVAWFKDILQALQLYGGLTDGQRLLSPPGT